MKVLLVRPYPSVIHLTQMTYNVQEIGLARALIRQGLECDIVLYGGKKSFSVSYPVSSHQNLTIYYRKALNVMKNGLFFHVKSLIDQYDLIQIGEYDQIQSLLFALRYPQKVLIYHGPYYDDFNTRYNMKCRVIDRLFLSVYHACHTHFITKSTLAEEFLRNKSLPHVTTIGVGIDTHLLCVDEGHKSALQCQLESLKKSHQLLLYIGRMEPRRNLKFLIRVFAAVKQVKKQACLVLIGMGDSSYVQACFDLAQRLDIFDAIIYEEKLEQKYLPGIYSCCDVFLLPSRYEIFGMVLLEAMFFQIPVLSSVNGGSKELIVPSQTGIIIEDFSIEQWKNEVCALLNHPRDAHLMGERARRFIEQYYTWDCLSLKFVALYTAFQGKPVR